MNNIFIVQNADKRTVRLIKTINTLSTDVYNFENAEIDGHLKRGSAVKVISDGSFPVELGDNEVVLVFSEPGMPVKEISGVAHDEICKYLFGKAYVHLKSALRTTGDHYHYYCDKCGETSGNRPYEGKCYCGDEMIEVGPCSRCGSKRFITETFPVTTFCPICSPELLEVFYSKVDEGE